MNMICNSYEAGRLGRGRVKLGFICADKSLPSVEVQQHLLQAVDVSPGNILSANECDIVDAAKACGAYSRGLFVVASELVLRRSWVKVFAALDRAGADLLIADGMRFYLCANGRTFEDFKKKIDAGQTIAARQAPKRRKGGARPKLSPRQLKNARILWEEDVLSTSEIARKYNVANNYFYRKFGPRKAASGVPLGR